jgi:hypothetical protein
MIFSIDFNNYPFVKVQTIQSGQDKEMIGWEPSVAGGFSGPKCFVLSHSGYVYIPDRVNTRLIILDSGFHFFREVKEKINPELQFTLAMKLDQNENIIYYSNASGLVKIDKDGNRIFFIKDSELPRQVKQYRNFFPIGDKVFVYNDEGEAICYNASGAVQNGDITQQYLSNYTIDEQKKQSTQRLAYTIPSAKQKVMDELRNDKRHIIMNDRYYTTNFSANQDYFTKIKDIKEFITKQQSVTRSNNLSTISAKDNFGNYLLGYDDDHNGYWRGDRTNENGSVDYAIIIYSRYGEILDVFQYGKTVKKFFEEYGVTGTAPDIENFPVTNAEIAIAPNGDVYFLVGNKKEYTFYKVTRRW